MVSQIRPIRAITPDSSTRIPNTIRMNLILLDHDSPLQTLDAQDRRALHISDVLMRAGKDSFFAGLRDGRMGTAKPMRLPDGSIELEVDWHLPDADPLNQLDLIVGMPRPQSARRMLRDIPTMGVRRVCFFVGEKGEAGYATSRLWKDGEWMDHLQEGAEQAFNPRIPDVTVVDGLENALSDLAPHPCRIALDLYEARSSYMDALVSNDAAAGATVAIGPERGWSQAERNTLRSAGFVLCSMGKRVMRSDAAVVAAASVWVAMNESRAS